MAQEPPNGWGEKAWKRKTAKTQNKLQKTRIQSAFAKHPDEGGKGVKGGIRQFYAFAKT